MMGAGIAYQCARSGIEVVLKDVSIEAAEKGKTYSENLVKQAVERAQDQPGKRRCAAGADYPYRFVRRLGRGGPGDRSRL